MSDQNPFQTSNTTATGQENQPQEAQQQQEEKKAGADKNGDDTLYVSPSDAIMSPASQKLSSFKQRQINKYACTQIGVALDGRPREELPELTYPSQTGTAAIPPAALSSLATCLLPRMPKKKNPSRLACLVSFFLECSRGWILRMTFTCTTTGEVDMFSRRDLSTIFPPLSLFPFPC